MRHWPRKSAQPSKTESLLFPMNPSHCSEFGSLPRVGDETSLAWRMRRSWVEIDLNKIVEQARHIKAWTQRELIAVVKADAYGHGAVPVAKALESEASMFGVANVLEALKLKAAGIRMPIMVLGSALPEEAEVAMAEGFELTLALPEQVPLYDAMAARLGTKAKLHVAIDTGMGRIGLMDLHATPELAAEWSAYPNLDWRAVATHLPSPDEDEAYTIEQMGRFNQCVETLRAGGLNFESVHLCNSAGSLGYIAHAQASQRVRVGLWLYGVNPLFGSGVKGEAIPANLALTWKARITAIREVPEGRGISYGRTFVTPKPMRVATVACGYADGYPRQLNGKGFYFLVRGQRCPILGRITMDQIMIDITALSNDVTVGEEVVLLGQQGGEVIRPEDLATLSGTITWDIFTAIGARATRFYLDPAVSCGATPARRCA